MKWDLLIFADALRNEESYLSDAPRIEYMDKSLEFIDCNVTGSVCVVVHSAPPQCQPQGETGADEKEVRQPICPQVCQSWD